MKMCADNGIIRLDQRLRITFYCKKGQFLHKFEKTVQKCENPYTSSAHFSLTILNQETSDPILEASFNGGYEDTPSYKQFETKRSHGALKKILVRFYRDIFF